MSKSLRHSFRNFPSSPVCQPRGGPAMTRRCRQRGNSMTLPSVEQQPQSRAGPLLGTWKLQSFTDEDVATGQKTDLFGAHPSGYLHYGPDGRMYAILLKEGRKAPDTLIPTDAERVDLYSGLIAYAGTYSIEGDKVSH